MQHPTPTPSLLAPSRTRYGVLAFACSLSLITYLDRICIMRAREDIQRDLGLSLSDMGLVFGAFSLGYALFEIPAGWMGDRWGTRRVLTRIVLCWSLFTALTGVVLPFSWEMPIFPSFSLFFNSLALMILIRFLFGLGEAGAYPNLTRVVCDWFPFRERAFAQGGIWMFARLGGAIAPFVIGRLSSVVGWRNAFYVLGVIGLIWVFFFRLWFRNRPSEHPGCNPAERRLIETDQPPAVDPAIAHSFPSFSLLLRSVTVWALCMASFWVCFGWYFYPTWQPKYLEEVHGFKPDGQTSEILSGLPFLCGAFGAILGGGLSGFLVQHTGSRRWGRSLIGIVGFTGAGICVLFTGFVTSAWQAVTLLCLAFLINDLAIPVIWAACADVGGRFAGSLSGLMNSVGAVGAILCPILIPNILELLPAHYSGAERWQVIFVGLAGAWFLAAAAWVFIDASRPLEQASHPATTSGVNLGPTSSVVDKDSVASIQRQDASFTPARSESITPDEH